MYSTPGSSLVVLHRYAADIVSGEQRPATSVLWRSWSRLTYFMTHDQHSMSNMYAVAAYWCASTTCMTWRRHQLQPQTAAVFDINH